MRTRILASNDHHVRHTNKQNPPVQLRPTFGYLRVRIGGGSKQQRRFYPVTVKVWNTKVMFMFPRSLGRGGGGGGGGGDGGISVQCSDNSEPFVH